MGILPSFTPRVRIPVRLAFNFRFRSLPWFVCRWLPVAPAKFTSFLRLDRINNLSCLNHTDELVSCKLVFVLKIYSRFYKYVVVTTQL